MAQTAAPVNAAILPPRQGEARGRRQVTDGSVVLLGVAMLTLALLPVAWRHGPILLRVLQVVALAVMLRCVDAGIRHAPGSASAVWQPGILVAFLLCLPAALTVFSRDWRAWLAARLQAGGATFREGSARHSTTLMLLLAVVVCSLAHAAVTDELSDLYDLPGLFMMMSLYLMFCVLGVGFPQRRSWSQASARLGLWLPGRRALLLAAGIGISLMALMSILWLLFVLVTWPQFAEGDSVPFTPGVIAALLSAAMTAIGEETMFRGVLQPLFGGVLTSICFALLHFRPGAEVVLIPIFGVSLAFAWLRFRHGTLAAICAHFCYNFTLGLAARLYGV